MSFPKHLICYNNHFYYQAKVPVDLKHHFSRTFIKKSLKTSDLREARTMLVAMEYMIHKAFTMIRTGMLPNDVIQQVVDGIVPLKQKTGLEGSTGSLSLRTVARFSIVSVIL